MIARPQRGLVRGRVTNARARGPKMKRLGIHKIVALSVSALMVAVGLVVSYATENPPIAAAQRGPEPAARPSLRVAQRSAVDSPKAEVVKQAGAVAEAPAPPVSKLPSLYPAPSAEGALTPTPEVRKPVPVRKAAPDHTLPPFQPPDWSVANTSAATSGRSPATLWLSGVIQGDPKVALLRRGDERYLVREGETFDGVYRVVRISSNRVALQRGSRKLTLRVGE